MSRSETKDGIYCADVAKEIGYPTEKILGKYPALKVALDEKSEVEKGLFREKGEQDGCGDLGWNDYSAKS